MTWLIILGVVTTTIGLAGLLVCIRRAAAVRKLTDPAQAKSRLQGLVALNLASLSVAMMGLVFVVIGLIL